MHLENDFIEYVQDQLSQWSNIDKKKMFGIIGLFKEGLMFGIISNDTVYLKVDDSNKIKYENAGSKPLEVFKNKSKVRSYYELPAEVLENSEEFIDWAKESFTIQKNKISNNKTTKQQIYLRDFLSSGDKLKIDIN